MWLSQLRFIFEPEHGEYGFCVVKQTNTLKVQELAHWVRVTVSDVARSLHIKVHKVRPLLLLAATDMQATRTTWTLQMVHDRCLELYDDPHQEHLVKEMTDLLLNDSDIKPTAQQELSPWQKACAAIAEVHRKAQYLGYLEDDTRQEAESRGSRWNARTTSSLAPPAGQ